MCLVVLSDAIAPDGIGKSENLTDVFRFQREFVNFRGKIAGLNSAACCETSLQSNHRVLNRCGEIGG